MDVGLGEAALFQGNRLWLHPLNSPGVHSEDEDHNDISEINMYLCVKAVMMS